MRVLVLMMLLFGLAGSASAAGGSQLINLTECALFQGSSSPLAGNVSTPAAIFDEDHQYITYKSALDPETFESGKFAVVVHFDGEKCSKPVRVNVDVEVPGSHDGPSIHVDGQGYLYVTYAGGTARNTVLRQSLEPLDHTSWGPEGRTRLFNPSESHGFQMEDGSLFLAGSDTTAHYDIVHPGGQTFEWEHARKNVSQIYGARGSNTGNCAGNRFSKTTFQSQIGDDNKLYAAWGWGRGHEPTARCTDPDSQYYVHDSHEVHFAYSDDGGLTWKNNEGTRVVESQLCPSRDVCVVREEFGIAHNDPDFRLTDTRHREFRKIWADPDGMVYIAFAKSVWCDSGICDTDANVTDPGALTLLRFTLGGEVEEITVDRRRHFNVAAIRKVGDALYIWAILELSSQSGWPFEYVSTDNGETWTAHRIGSRAGCGRMHGTSYTPSAPNSVVMAFSCGRDVFYYHRWFE